jgi:hypothetical protein
VYLQRTVLEALTHLEAGFAFNIAKLDNVTPLDHLRQALFGQVNEKILLYFARRTRRTLEIQSTTNHRYEASLNNVDYRR